MHLAAGSMAAGVILIMSVTGCLLMYEKQVVAWAERGGYRVAAASGAPALTPEQLLAMQPERPQSVTLRPGSAEPVELGYTPQRALYVHAASGKPLGPTGSAARRFFRSVTDWHRWLALSGERRGTGKAMTGAANLVFLFIVVSGLYLWLPKAWSRQHLRPIVWFRSGLSGKARDFNWHNVFGIWCAIPLFFIVLGATVISYPWASNLAYRVAGSEPPRPAPAPPGGSAAGGVPRIEGLNAAVAAAQSRVPDWKLISVRLPVADGAPWVLNVERGYPGQPHLRGTLTIGSDGVERWEDFAQLDSGRRFRTWLRFVHTGEYYGLAGQTVAGMASAAGAFLVWTGIALALRRLFAWRKRRVAAMELERPRPLVG